MSLLLEALKQAAQAKEKKAAENAPEPDSHDLELEMTNNIADTDSATKDAKVISKKDNATTDNTSKQSIESLSMEETEILIDDSALDNTTKNAEKDDHIIDYEDSSETVSTPTEDSQAKSHDIEQFNPDELLTSPKETPQTKTPQTKTYNKKTSLSDKKKAKTTSTTKTSTPNNSKKRGPNNKKPPTKDNKKAPPFGTPNQAATILSNKKPKTNSSMLLLSVLGILVFIGVGSFFGYSYYLEQDNTINHQISALSQEPRTIITPISEVDLAINNNTIGSEQTNNSATEIPEKGTLTSPAPDNITDTVPLADTPKETELSQKESKPINNQIDDEITSPPTLNSVIQSHPLSLEYSEPAAKIKNIPPSIKIRVKQAPQKVNTNLSKAYSAFTRGNIDKAAQYYNRVLLKDTNNIDALLGVAAIAVIDKETDRAIDLYTKVLDLNPTNATAKAGLLSLNNMTDINTSSESEIKILINQKPDNASLYFNLGNIYLAQSRTANALNMFIKANNLSPGNPDVLLNIAICLDNSDKLNQAKEYYQRAIIATNYRHANFNVEQIKMYLLSLSHPVTSKSEN